jgi:Phosphotransferase enzyme family
MQPLNGVDESTPHRSSLQAEFPQAELERLLGERVAGFERVESGGYGRVNAHWRVRLRDGRSVFVKHALTPEAEEWLAKERLVYEHVRGAFMPDYLGADDAFLVLEDLSTADWPPPWSSQRIDSVLRVLSDVRSSARPARLPRLVHMLSEIVGWPTVADDPDPMLSTGVCSAQWLDAALPALLAAAGEAELDGDDLLHADVRSDNLCFKAVGPVLVDWNIACIGNGAFDVAFWLPSLRLEGGPQPWEVLSGAGGLAAAVAGFFAARVGRPAPVGAPTVREFQLRQLEVALPWAARELRQAPP